MKCRALILAFACCVLPPTLMAAAQRRFRPPAVPLVTRDPYFSVWSFADHLTDEPTRHWTGTEQSLESLARVDGRCYRIMGSEPADVPALRQVGLKVTPTRTVYDFQGVGVHITLSFLSPVLANDLDLLSRPVTYVAWDVRSTDGKRHAVALYFAAAAELVVNTTDEAVVWSRPKMPRLTVLRMGSKDQPVLAKSGDNLRIDWGYLYAATLADPTVHAVVDSLDSVRRAFASTGSLPVTDDSRVPRAARDDMPALAFAFELGGVGRKTISRHLILAYDEEYAIEYFHQRLRPYWRRNGADARALVEGAEREYAALQHRCEVFDRELTGDLARLGGEKYAQLAALAYRQSLAAQKLVVGPDGEPFFFPKENFSNGCIGTVDVIYPASPILLLLNPRLLGASLVPLLKYAESGRWHFPFAPHDLGTYPLANGQVYGGRETSDKDQMPVEESGNMLLMIAAIAWIEGNANFAVAYWPLLQKWAEYLDQEGLDPANQLCTDDFAGHLAHNANLSLKAIEALGAFAVLCEMKGDRQQAELYRKTAQEFAARWPQMADDGDHYRLAFDKPGTWSQKYNLVWDNILGLRLFDPAIARKETAYYLTKETRFGFPLDNRKDYTKLDWEFWSATLAGSQPEFQKLIAPIYDWANESPGRVPLTDWYWTTTGKQAGFQARSVVGSLYIKMLADPVVWKKWADRAVR